MRSKLSLLPLLVILLTGASGCLPSVPGEIHGPTWTSHYRFPLLKEKRIYLLNEVGSMSGFKQTSLVLSTTFQEESSEPTEVEEDPSVKFDEVNVFFTIKNTSPVGLHITVQFSPDPIAESDPEDIIEKKLSIPAKKTETSVLPMASDELSDLISSGKVYHQINITLENPGQAGFITELDYLEITAWADAICTFNKR